MAHPNGGHGKKFPTKHTFNQAYTHIGINGIHFKSTTNERIFAVQSFAKDKKTRTIMYYGKHSRHGNVCSACWGYRVSCNKTWIGQCSETLDKAF
jgi:hypothetical protein